MESCAVPLGISFASPTIRFVRRRDSRILHRTVASVTPASSRKCEKRRMVASSGTMPEKIAVVGGGLAGLATAYHLLYSTYRVAKKRGTDHHRINVTIFDPAEPGVPAGASAVCAGLLHPFSPRAKKFAWKAEKGIDNALALLSAVQPYSDSPLLESPGIVRFGLTEKQRKDYEVAKNRFPRFVNLLSEEQLMELLPDPPLNTTGLIYEKGAVVNTPAYFRALWKACSESGRVNWVQERVSAFEELFNGFDSVIVCAGAASRTISNIAHVPILPCRGQNIRFRPRKSATKPPGYPLISGKYIVPDLFSDSSTVLAGATFEYCDPRVQSPQDFANGTTPPDLDYALQELAEPLQRISPMLTDLWEPEKAFAGVRALPPRSLDGSIPIAGEIKGAPEGKSAWLLTGLGSRGLLHHSFLAKAVARCAVGGKDILIPDLARRIPLDFDKLSGNYRPEMASKLFEKPLAVVYDAAVLDLQQ